MRWGSEIKHQISRDSGYGNRFSEAMSELEICLEWDCDYWPVRLVM